MDNDCLTDKLTNETAELILDRFDDEVSSSITLGILELATYTGECPEYFAKYALEFDIPEDSFNIYNFGFYLLKKMQQEENAEDSFRYRAKGILAPEMGDLGDFDFYYDGQNIHVLTSEMSQDFESLFDTKLITMNLIHTLKKEKQSVYETERGEKIFFYFDYKGISPNSLFSLH